MFIVLILLKQKNFESVFKQKLKTFSQLTSIDPLLKSTDQGGFNLLKLALQLACQP